MVQTFTAKMQLAPAARAASPRTLQRYLWRARAAPAACELRRRACTPFSAGCACSAPTLFAPPRYGLVAPPRRPECERVALRHEARCLTLASRQASASRCLPPLRCARRLHRGAQASTLHRRQLAALLRPEPPAAVRTRTRRLRAPARRCARWMRAAGLPAPLRLLQESEASVDDCVGAVRTAT